MPVPNESEFIRPRIHVDTAGKLVEAFKSMYDWGPVHYPELFSAEEYAAIADLYYILAKLLVLRDARTMVKRLRGD